MDLSSPRTIAYPEPMTPVIDDQMPARLVAGGIALHRRALKKAQGIILCRHPAGQETLKQARSKGYGVWTYRLTVQKNPNKPREPLFGMHIMDLKGTTILKT